MLSWALCGLGVGRLIQISTVLIPLLPLESMLTSVIGITALTVAALLTALLFSETSNLTNYYFYCYNEVTVTNKKM